jgi:hypothetical protein
MGEEEGVDAGKELAEEEVNQGWCVSLFLQERVSQQQVLCLLLQLDPTVCIHLQAQVQ